MFVVLYDPPTSLTMMPYLRPILSLLSITPWSFSRPSADYQCIVIEVTLVTADSMTAIVPRSQCGTLRIVLLGEPKRIRPIGFYSWTRRFEIAVALINSGTSPLKLPVRMRVDSAAPVQRGQQLNAFFVRNYLTFDFWDGQETQQPWTFSSSEQGGTVLAAGEQTAVRVLKVNTTPLAQSARVWVRIEGNDLHALTGLPIPPAATAPFVQSDTPTTAISAFILGERLPNLHSATTIYRDAMRDISLFTVSFGEPHDCPSGCFYSGAVGLQYGSQIGWLRAAGSDQDALSQARIRGRSFAFSSQSKYLLSQEFTDTLASRLGRYNYVVDQVLLPILLPHPDLPRSRLVKYAEGLYSEIDQPLASILIVVPQTQGDSELLTLLANLPDGGPPYEAVRERARAKIREMAPSLITDTSVSGRTLFVLAQVLQPFRDTAIMMALADHPHVRDTPATLTVLARSVSRLNARVLSSVKASAPAKTLLSRYLSDRSGTHDSVLGWELLHDPQSGTNQDILAVLANTQISQDQDIVWAASRRLPEEALKSAEYPNIPLRR